MTDHELAALEHRLRQIEAAVSRVESHVTQIRKAELDGTYRQTALFVVGA